MYESRNPPSHLTNRNRRAQTAGKKPDFLHAASHIFARSPSSCGIPASDSDTWTALSVEMNTSPIASLSGVIAVLCAL